jgi:hypothetical protein
MMKSFRVAFAAAFAVLANGASAQTEPPLEPGSYEVAYRLELPHVERWAINRTTTICVLDRQEAGALPLPILSGNMPFAGCTSTNWLRDGVTLTYTILCEGRDAAKARAVYRLAPGTFHGRVFMVMGAKNMTMTEVQRGRRVGACDGARASVE